MRWCMLITRYKPKETRTLSQYVTLIAFRLQKFLHERASMLRYTCTACIVISYK